MQERAAARAMRVHSKHKPREVVEDIDGDGSFDYALSDLASWDDDFSRLRSVEYPVDDTDEDVDVVEQADWGVYEKPSGKVLRFFSDTPDTGETIRVRYTAPHSCTDSACTVASEDEEAVETLAASFYAKMLAAAYALQSDSTIAADAVNHQSKSDRFLKIAKEYRAEYDQHLGIKDGKPKPASINQDQDVDYPGGMDRLTHPRKYR